MRRTGAADLGLLLLLAAAALSACTTAPEIDRGGKTAPPSVYQPAAPELPQRGPELSDEQDAPVLVGSVIKVTDGDTIKVQLSSGPISVRFHSIDAPERDQPWGAEAGAALAGRLGGQQVALDVVEQDHYERLVAVVYLGDDNVNAWMVQQGHAWAYREYLDDPDYCVWEADARSAGRGLWRLPPDQHHAPWDWRAVKRGAARPYSDYTGETATHCIASMRRSTRAAAPELPAPRNDPGRVQPSGPCRIKGNIGDSGRIYHVPGSAWYERTEINESKGERWFCSEQEARDAGWRAPRG